MNKFASHKQCNHLNYPDLILHSFQWVSEVLKINITLLCGEIEDGKLKCMKIPQGFKKYYKKDNILLLWKGIYKVNHAVIVYWQKQCQVHQEISDQRSTTDPCMHCKGNVKERLVIWKSRVNYNSILTSREEKQLNNYLIWIHWRRSNEGIY